MAQLKQDELARFRDGELSESERARVEEALRGASPQERAELGRLDRLGDLLRTLHEEQLAQVTFDGFAERVAAGVRAARRPPLGERVRVWLSEFFEHRRGVWIPAASLAGAAAAVAIALPLFLGSPSPVAPTAPRGSFAAGPIWQASAAPEAAASPGSVAVLSYGGQASGVSYTIPNERGEAIGVVWLND